MPRHDGDLAPEGVRDAEKGEVPSQPAPPLTPSGVRGNPAPFGLLCNGMTTCILMFMITSWSNSAFTPVIMGYALFYGGLGQLIAGILELIRGNTFAGAAFGSYGAFWMGYFVFKYLEATKAVPVVAQAALTGDTLWCVLFGVLTSLFFFVSLNKNTNLQIVLGTLALTFFLVAGGNYSANARRAGGYVGFICGAYTVYAAFALICLDDLGLTLPGVRPTRYIRA